MYIEQRAKKGQMSTQIHLDSMVKPLSFLYQMAPKGVTWYCVPLNLQTK